MDIIFISELRLNILIGIYEWERVTPQTVQFDLEIGVPGQRATQSDRIEDTIDYAKVVARIEESLRENRIGLLEKLAEHVAQMIMQEFRAPWVKLSITKLAPLKSVKRLGITIERGNRQ